MLDKRSYREVIRSNRLALLVVPLTLTSFTHLWNPVGFPDLFYDEGVYLRRTMHVLDGLGVQESPYFYDHPFFGQLFLAGIFKLLNFPTFIADGDLGDVSSIDSLIFVPRMIMGGLAILDTFLVYKIAEKRYGANVALVASILFSVMPMTWIFRRVVLDSILVPFFLSSILFALNSSINRKYTWTLLSGICFGLAILVKVPTFAIMPLLCYLVLQPMNTNSNERRYKLLMLWLIPVVVIPSLWPLESILSGHLDSWLDTVVWQAERGNRALGLPWMTALFIVIDPLLFALSVVGGIYAVLRKNWLILLWEVPFIVFLGAIGQTNYFHWAPLLPVFCIASSIVLLRGLPQLLATIKVYCRQIILITIFSIAILGLAFTTIVISTDVSLAQRQALSYAITYLESYNDSRELTIISSPSYSWIFKYVYRADNTLNDFRDVIFDPIETSDWLLVVDEHFRSETQAEPKLLEIYEQRQVIEVFNSYPLAGDETVRYPYTSLLMTTEGCDIEIASKRVNQQEGLSENVDSEGTDNLSRCNLALERLQSQYTLP